MASTNTRDILTSFSPSSDFFAITSGDGRIKIWDTLKGQLQTEFADIPASDELGMLSETKRGHLSLDYTCMKWIQLESKKKRRKAGGSLLVIGTGGGDVLALDVAAGQLKWKVSDCHPGGVKAVCFSIHRLCIYTAGADGMVCQIDTYSGNVLGRFRSSEKAISSLSVSSDGRMFAAAAGQLKTFSCSDNKKIQKFSGHPVAVRCMIFSEDGQYILSSGIGERCVAIWKVGHGKTQSADCILSMDHPAIFVDSKGADASGSDGGGLYVLAISEIGICYFWYGNSFKDLRNGKPTKISLSESSGKRIKQGFTIFAAKLEGIVKPASGQVLVAYGSIVKPSFEKLLVCYGTDINLDASRVGILIPASQSDVSRKGQTMQNQVTALDRANTEDALHPLPKLFDLEKKRKHGATDPSGEAKAKLSGPAHNINAALPDKRGTVRRMEEDEVVCIQDKLTALGILSAKVDLNTEIPDGIPRYVVDMFPGSNLSVDANVPIREIRANILSMSSDEAYNFLEKLISAWKERSASSKHILLWIYCILVNHGHFIISQNRSSQMLDDLHKMTTVRSAAAEDLLKLSGRFQLILTQIGKAGKDAVEPPSEIQHDEVENEEDTEDEDIDELVYGEEEDESENSSDADE